MEMGGTAVWRGTASNLRPVAIMRGTESDAADQDSSHEELPRRPGGSEAINPMQLRKMSVGNLGGVR
jgi:hypothetical protein